MSTPTATTYTARQAVAAVFAAHDATRRRGTNIWEVPSAANGRLEVTADIRGSVTTNLEVERWWALDTAGLPGAYEWLKEHIWPAGHRWCERTRHWNTLPTPGLYSGTWVLTAEAADVLALWLPQELAWQVEAAARADAQIAALASTS